MRPNSLHAADLAHMVHQQTDLGAHAADGAVLIARGEGVHVWDTEGKEYIEAMAGLWCASLGFSEKRLAEAAYRQLLTLPYYHTFFQKGHEPSVRLAEKLTAIAPPGLNHAMFQCGGSEANDAAIKLAWYYHNVTGRPQKKKIIGRIRGYHGNTVATASLSGQPHMQADFDLPLGDRFLHISNPNYYRAGLPGETEEQFSERMAAELQALIDREGADTIAAFFAEPVQGGGGAITPPRGYFEAIVPILKQAGILFVADEVICGFGRTGHYWGCETYGIQPDMLSCAKQLTAAYQPLSALLISDAIHAALLEGSKRNGSFGHGYTYGGHPVACAVALETLAIYEERDMVGHVQAVSPAFLDGLGALRDHPLVGDVRGVGLIAGVELMADKAKKEPFPAGAKVGLLVQEKCHAAGLIVRAIGDRIAFTPPLIITAAQIGEMCRRFRAGLDAAWAELQERRLAAE
ncbi:aminotransferase class III-fold pyridoxal phosphate-dependent enzyme [Dankookia rubra]|uniref:Aminotransferase class III-fold pyridoxal phosphate-dependent enzyme n=1 Tax=Dankookia rubra TaxID=1442381 RepID=A0A4R5Q7X0_9PROT|nr:aminotransferase [Dankookia rubra]TDH59020.1 aminotransferase class III-fold pyridoxal phosphate-dependent enzyme [Dankookia rubra]